MQVVHASTCVCNGRRTSQKDKVGLLDVRAETKHDHMAFMSFRRSMTTMALNEMQRLRNETKSSPVKGADCGQLRKLQGKVHSCLRTCVVHTIVHLPARPTLEQSRKHFP